MHRKSIAGLAAWVVLAAAVAAQDEGEREKRRNEDRKHHEQVALMGQLELTEEQKAAIQALREKIDAETVGYNRVVVWFLHEEMKAITARGKGDGHGQAKRNDLTEEQRAQLQALRQRLEEVHAGIRAGMQRFHEGVLAILTEAQRAKLEELQAARAAEREKRQHGEGKDPERGHQGKQPPPKDPWAEGVDLDQALQHGLFYAPRDRKPGRGPKQ